MTDTRSLCWFSCGAASAVATKLAMSEGPVDIVYQDTGGEHPDNVRFLQDCERWFGQSVNVIRSEKYSDPWQVWEERKYIAGIAGAPCTSELKRIPAEKYLFDHYPVGTVEVYGYTADEAIRVKRWKKQNPERVISAPLIDRNISKGECLAMLQSVGIDLPVMYQLGYRNNNCIGCPKGQSGYWNKIRQDFPDVFARMAKLERKLDAAICKTEPTINGKRQRIRVFLDELPPDAGNYKEEPSIACGLFCQSALDDLNEDLI